jgi:hypothetical protein
MSALEALDLAGKRLNAFSVLFFNGLFNLFLNRDNFPPVFCKREHRFFWAIYTV